MKLLVVTQVMDEKDPVLGFFTHWVAALADRFESIEVICLQEGVHVLPHNVKVYSLGKEKGRSSTLAYALRFYRLIWRLRGAYDAVLVHMNQEYVLLGAPLWKRLGKRIFMWRNHYAGNAWTDRAIVQCEKVFSTSKFSYTARSPKNVLMPVGVDTDVFKPQGDIARDPRAILSLGRLAPSKRIEVLLRALGMLKKRNVHFTASIYGAPLPQDRQYAADLQALAQELGIDADVAFKGSVPQSEAQHLYVSHGIFVNCSRSGMYDKTMFEAAASECLVLASSEDFKQLAGEQFSFNPDDSADLAHKLEHLLSLAHIDRQGLGTQLRNVAKGHSLEMLAGALSREIARR